MVAEEAARRGERVGVAHVCAAAVAALPVDGAGMSAMTRPAASHPLCGTDEVSRALEELQLTLGEGPCVDAFALGAAVLAPDLGAGDILARWPVFAPAAAAAGAGAVFALPLQIGAISPGVFDLYRREPGVLGGEDLADAMAFAATATLLLLGGPAGGRPGPDGPDGSGDGGAAGLGAYRAQIDQATGMLTEQLGVGIEEAFVRLRAHAYARGRRLADLAADVVDRRVRFTPETEGTAAGPAPDRTDDDQT
nr:ANTAR domain-containing protein [Streptomyces sp. SID4948]